MIINDHQGPDVQEEEQESRGVAALVNYPRPLQFSGAGKQMAMWVAPDFGKLRSLCSFSLSRRFPEGKFFTFTFRAAGFFMGPGCPVGCGGGPMGAWVLEKRSEKPKRENPRETERPEPWRKQRAPGPKRLRSRPRQEVGRGLFSVCSWELSWKVLW